MTGRRLFGLLLPALLLADPALAQEPRRRRRTRPAPAATAVRRAPAPAPGIDPPPAPPGAAAAPLPDRRFPSEPAQAADPRPSVSFGVPVGAAPTRGSSFTERDPNPDAQAQERASRLPAPGLQLRLPVP